MKRAILIAMIVGWLLSVAPAVALPVGCGGTPHTGSSSIAVSPASLSFTGDGSQNLSFLPNGNEMDGWDATKTQSWITLGAATGTCDGNGVCQILAVSVANAGSMAPGTYNGFVNVTPYYLNTCNTTTKVTLTTINVAVTLTVSAPASISASANPTTISLTPGGGAQATTISITRTNYTGSVSLATSTLPTGVTATITQPGTGTSGSISLSAAANAPPVSNQTITVTASGSGVSNATTTFSLTVSALPAISLTANTSSVTLSPGGSAQNASFTLSRTNYTGSVSLAASTLPTGVTATITQPGTGTSGTISLTAAANAPAVSNQTITVTASGTGVSNATTTFSLTVSALPAISLTANTSSVTLSPGGSAQNATFTLSRTNYTGSVSLAASTLPTGVTATITQPGTGTSGSISLTAAANAPAVSNQTITVTATGSGVSNATATFSLTVSALPAISLSANTSSVTLSPGGSAQNATFTLSRTNFTGSVSLATSTLPTGVTATITQPGTGTSGSISLTAAANAPAVSNQTITVTASGTGVSNATATFSLTVSALPAISLTANTSSVTLSPGGSAQNASFTLSRTNYTGSVSLATSTLPTGVTATITQPGTGTSGSISLTAAANAPAVSNQTITVTASGSGVSNATTTFSLTVSALPAISLNANTSSVTLSPGGSAQNATFTLSRTNYTGSVSLATSTLPTGVTATITQPGTGTSGSISLTAAANAPAVSNQTITVTASGSGVSNATATFTLSIAVVAQPILAVSANSLDFTAATGANPASQSLQVTNAGSGALGWTASVSTGSGGNWLQVSPTTGVAPSTITAGVTSASLAAGTYRGTLTVSALPSANATGTPQNVSVNLLIGVPTFPANGLTNAASYETSVSPGSIATLFGVNLASSLIINKDLPLPTILGGTQVLVGFSPNEVAAPLFFVAPGQVNFQMPAGLSGPTVPMVVVSNGVRSQPVNVSIAVEVPGIFTMTQTGKGQGAVLNQDYTINAATNAAARGSVIQIFATGLGPTNPPFTTGQLGASVLPLNETVVKPVVLINGASADVKFSGLAPGFVGLYQVNALVPATTPVGNSVSLVIQMNGKSSNAVTIAVK